MKNHSLTLLLIALNLTMAATVVVAIVQAVSTG